MTCFHQAKDLYLEALRMPQAELAAFLEERCGDDDKLRREIELLMEVDAIDTTMFAEEATSKEQAPELQADEVVAGHRIIRKLGEGGMGTVYLTRNIELNCEVAFKVLHRAHDTPVFNAQFLQERRTLAMMQHPGIARVRQSGFTPGGRAWFTMDYIDGSPLTSYCDQYKLDLQQRLELLIKICDAVQYAHGKMVIHRDLNPNNILVTTDERGQPQPHLIDFGISRLLEHDEQTSESLPTRCGTPPYMSPEQYLGHEDQIEVRSDIYALGVLLYKLSTGREPFDRQQLKKPMQQLGTFLRKTTPQLPSDRFLEVSPSEQRSFVSKMDLTVRKLVKRLRDGVDWIAFTAVTPRREDRYSSADAMASDLKRFLSQHPVESAPSSSMYRMKLFLRRNWAAVATISLVMYLLIAGTVYFLYQNNRLNEQTDQLTQQAELIEGQLLESRQAFTLLKDTIFEGMTPYTIQFEHPESKSELMNRLVAMLDATPSINMAMVADLRFKIGTVHLMVGLDTKSESEFLKAEQQFNQARDLYAQLDGDYRSNLDQIESSLTLIYTETDRMGPRKPTESDSTTSASSPERIKSIVDKMLSPPTVPFKP
ncbi:MAG: serine/threonine-protein kinase [Phycisphaerales bacterium]|nr:serine/threonine-protein kinase [Phycisphaerales bacterium]